MPGRHWTEKEKRLLRRLLKLNQDPGEIDLPGRSEYSIRAQLRRMELVDTRPGRFKWPLAQRRLLQKYQREGLTPKQIHDFGLLGEPYRSLWAITKQWGRMKLADRQRSRSMRHRKQWAPGERQKFDEFLREHSSQMTPEEIGRQWQVARSTVARRQTELGVKQPRSEVLQMPFSQAKQRKARRKLRQDNLRNWALRREEREQQLLELAQQLREGERPPREQVCVDCQRSWPRRKEFFHSSEKKISIGTSRYFKRRCVLCENSRRRELDRDRKRKRSRAGRCAPG